jgi:hypothetical protein
MWAKFETLEAFDLWHNQIKEQLGIPLSDGITTAYTQAQLIADGSYCAFVEDEHGEGLVSTERPKSPREIILENEIG